MPDWDDLLAALTATPGVTGAAIVSRDGIPVATKLPGGAFPDSLCAMAAAGFAAFETATQDVAGGADYADISARRGRMVIHGGHPDVLYVVLGAPETSTADLVAAIEERLVSAAQAR